MRLHSLVIALALGVVTIVSNAQAPARPALTVSTTQATRTTLPIRLAANGSIAAWDEATLGAETTGLRITEVRAAVGDQVRRGELIATFASDTLEAELLQARAALAEAQAQLAEASSNAARARSLQSTEALSPTQIGQYLSTEQTASARVASAKAQIAIVETRLLRTRLLAPDSGVITARQATVGLVPAPGQELFRLLRQGRLEWRAEVTAEELLRLRPGVAASLSLSNGQSIRGRVRMVAPTVDPVTRNAIVYVDLPSMNTPEGSALRPGMFARGQFELGEATTLVVPQSALALREGFSYVFRVEADQRVTQLKVQTGRSAGDKVEIMSGLEGGETLVASGAGFLNDGDRVRISVDTGPGRR